MRFHYASVYRAMEGYLGGPDSERERKREYFNFGDKVSVATRRRHP